MRKHLFFLAAALCFASSACQLPATAEPKPRDPLVVVATASYPGANCQVVADTIAAPIEQQINGAEGLLRIESEAKNDGSYSVRVLFDSKTDPQAAVKAIEKRIALAEPALPDLVRRNGISVKIAEAKPGEQKPAIALIDRGEHGFDALQKLAGALTKRLAADGAITKPVIFPVAEKQALVQIDRKKCAQLGVSLADVYTVMQAAGSTAKADVLKKLKVRSTRNQMIPVGTIAAIEEVTGPTTVYRLNLFPAIRISGTPPEGKSAADAAKRWLELAEAELKRGDSKGFALENLSAR